MDNYQEETNHAGAQSRAEGANLTDELASARRTPTKVVPGSELHLSLLMAKYGLNFVTGQDRQDLLAWGRDVWDAAKSANGEANSAALKRSPMEAEGRNES